MNEWQEIYYGWKAFSFIFFSLFCLEFYIVFFTEEPIFVRIAVFFVMAFCFSASIMCNFIFARDALFEIEKYEK